jgi:hypothetical protein
MPSEVRLLSSYDAILRTSSPPMAGMYVSGVSLHQLEPPMGSRAVTTLFPMTHAYGRQVSKLPQRKARGSDPEQ